MSKAEQFNQVVKKLRANVPEIRGVMIASTDGLPIATDIAADTATRVAAMAAAAVGLGNRISQTTQLGGMSETMIKGSDGLFLMFMAGKSAVLALQAPGGSNLGLIRMEGSSAAREAAKIADV